MIGGLTKGDKTAEAGKTSNQPREVLVAEHVVNAINDLQKLHDRLCSPQGNDCVNDIQKFAQDGGGLCEFRLLQSYINYVEEDEPSIEKLTIMKFLRSIIEDEELYVKLHNFNYLHPDFDGIPGSIDYEEIRSQLSRIVTDCKLENLEDKIRLLALLRGRMDFADIQKAYDNWRFSDLIGDNDFKRMYVDQAVKERENLLVSTLRKI
ncbi:uncharacterized protein TNCT_629921 [Trichonephila clavata]|uniref:Uncharacterized protein n=1 Tax=Trichonephila clavata TaxID=2740835 RepID=A0A8X6L9Q3_TRICU|nr:uncharacterized protein TNCT_629921 [Trichonephila clavata]